MVNHTDLSFTDEEVITIYFFGVIDKKTVIKVIFRYADWHLRNWFPLLSSYAAYIQQLNKVSDIFALLLAIIEQEQVDKMGMAVWLIDSSPVVLAKQGYCFRHSIGIGRRGAGMLPCPSCIVAMVGLNKLLKLGATLQVVTAAK